MSYIDGFVLAVPTANKQKFLDHANPVDALFLDHGATRVVECWGEDVPDGKQTDFRRAVAAKEGETVLFSWVEWPDKDTRDKGMKAFMADERLHGMPDMPFDGDRMIMGGFMPIVEFKK